jgi:hypothetical protein
MKAEKKENLKFHQNAGMISNSELAGQFPHQILL